ncbi:MAG TPA: sigma-54 dependent transcriptional regulator [Bryobacteraceae bacterium]|nr:sigma-54 dependent transcriptional regulator [Bryobacteraceae bacterium]
MPCRLLVIGDGSGHAHVTLGGLPLDERWRIERSMWDRLAPESIDWSANLVVAVAVGQMDRAVPLFEWLKRNPISSPVFAILPEEADADALRISMQAVDDFVLWPVRQEEVHIRLMRLLGTIDAETSPAEIAFQSDPLLPQLVGGDPAFVEILRQLPALGRTDAPVLITGETGTGKEMCARAIHHLTPRCSFPFIPVDCAAIPDHLFENELFGHSRGAYTDAHGEQKGLVAMADRGTLFLDEIDTLPPAVQPKLLRFLQERMFRPLGSDRFMRSDVRIVAATNRNIESCVKLGTFRSDLYFRLNVLRLTLPPLRERPGDVAMLARHFLELLSDATCPRKSLSTAALQKLTTYQWPGNVRELYNIMQRALVFADGHQILPHHICLSGQEKAEDQGPEGFREARARHIAAFERQYVEDVLRQSAGNITRAAHAAHKDRRAFGRLVKKYGIHRTLD